MWIQVLCGPGPRPWPPVCPPGPIHQQRSDCWNRHLKARQVPSRTEAARDGVVVGGQSPAETVNPWCVKWFSAPSICAPMVGQRNRNALRSVRRPARSGMLRPPICPANGRCRQPDRSRCPRVPGSWPDDGPSDDDHVEAVTDCHSHRAAAGVGQVFHKAGLCRGWRADEARSPRDSMGCSVTPGGFVHMQAQRHQRECKARHGRRKP